MNENDIHITVSSRHGRGKSTIARLIADVLFNRAFPVDHEDQDNPGRQANTVVAIHKSPLENANQIDDIRTRMHMNSGKVVIREVSTPRNSDNPGYRHEWPENRGKTGGLPDAEPRRRPEGFVAPPTSLSIDDRIEPNRLGARALKLVHEMARSGIPGVDPNPTRSYLYSHDPKVQASIAKVDQWWSDYYQRAAQHMKERAQHALQAQGPGTTPDPEPENDLDGG